MRGAYRIGAFAAAGAATLLIELAVVTDASGQSAPTPLLTDTPQYCAELSDEVEEDRQALVSPAPAEIEQLAEEGRQLCALGQVRGGIVRLRRAIVLLLKASGHS
ncbi:MAG TPA: hypothetical protein VMA86_07560 [Acetobacteraceae bacterium]|nr:hypothetical protein [Acetobacteraceae bacterium]